MGAFFTNIHIWTPQRALQKIHAAIVRAAAADGFVPSTGDDVVDRTVLVAATSSPNWIVVYDQSSDAMDVKALEALGRATSEDGFAVTAMVHDSDDLLLTLFKDGTRKDRIAFTPSGVPPKIKLAAWRALLGAEKSIEFEKAFQEPTAFAEEPLEWLARLLGWDPDYAFLGYAYRDELPAPPVDTIPFTLPAEKRFYSFESGPPVLDAFIERTRVTLALGVPLEGMGCGVTFRNIGGPSKGLTALLEYSAEVEEYLDVRGIRIRAGDPMRDTLAAVELVEGGGTRYLRARFPDVRLPPTPVWKQGRLEEWQGMRIFELSNQAHILVEAAGKPRKAGKLSAVLWALPHEHAEGGGRGELEIEIRPEPWWDTR